MVPTTHEHPTHEHPDHEHPDHQHRGQAVPWTEQEWDERYAASTQVWSGEPNGALVAEVSGLAPGRALDVGCGEGADALWLAARGWDVTALDVSGVALARARAAAARADASVTWVHAGLREAGLPHGAYDLVSAQYAVLRRTPGREAERALLDAVALGGTLLVVHHEVPAGVTLGFDPADVAMPADVAALLDDAWQVEVDERRPRSVSEGAGAGHSTDLVLRARRRG